MGCSKQGTPCYCPSHMPMRLAPEIGPMSFLEIKNKTNNRKKRESCPITKNCFMEAVINVNFIGMCGRN